MPCPCGSGRPYGECCGPLHEGAAAPTAEALMRSRYSAFALGDRAYLHASWHPSTRPAEVVPDGSIEWRRLRIVDADEDGDTAVVEFRAHFRRGGAPDQLHERSRFVRDRGRWSYLDGEVRDD